MPTGYCTNGFTKAPGGGHCHAIFPFPSSVSSLSESVAYTALDFSLQDFSIIPLNDPLGQTFAVHSLYTLVWATPWPSTHCDAYLFVFDIANCSHSFERSHHSSRDERSGRMGLSGLLHRQCWQSNASECAIPRCEHDRGDMHQGLSIQRVPIRRC